MTRAEGGERPEDTGAQAQARQHKGTRQLLLSQGLLMATGYVAAIILARGLGPTRYGVFGVIVSAVVWVQMLASAGIQGAASKLIPDHLGDSQHVEVAARALLVATSISLFAIGWLLAPYAAELFAIEDGARLFRVALLDVPATAAYVGYQGILNGHRRFGALAVAHSLYGLTKLAGILILLWLGLSVMGALIVNVLATAGVLVYLTSRHPPALGRPTRDGLGMVVRVALPMGAYLVAMQVLTSVDLWSLKSLWRGSQDVIGHYVASLTIAKVFLVIPVVQSGVVFTLIAWALARGDEGLAADHLKEASRFALLAVAPASMLIAFNAGPVMAFLFGEEYRAGGRYLSVHLLGYGLFALLDVYMHAIMSAGRQRLAAGSLISILPIVLAANILLIPWLGPIGAALSQAGGIALGTILAAWLAYHRFRGLVRWNTLWKVAVTLGVAIPLSLGIHAEGILLLVKLVALELGCLVALGALGELHLSDFRLSGPRPESAGGE